MHFFCVCVRVHFSKGLAKKVLRKPPKSCAGVLMSRETLTAMSVGGESGCRKTLIQAHSVAALELKRPTIPGPGASGSQAERREPTASRGLFRQLEACTPVVLFSSELLPFLILLPNLLLKQNS